MITHARLEIIDYCVGKKENGFLVGKHGRGRFSGVVGQRIIVGEGSGEKDRGQPKIS